MWTGWGESSAVSTSLPAVQRLWSWGRVALAIEVGATAGVGVAVGLQGTQRVSFVLVVVSLWVVAAYHQGQAVVSPARRQLHQLWTASASVLALVAIAVGFGAFPQSSIAESVACVAACSTAAAGARLLRRSWRGRARAVVVGDRLAIATLVSQWAGSRKVRPVAAVVVEPDLSPEDVPQELLGVPIFASMDQTPELVRRFAATSVVVSPGPGFTSTDFRALTWMLERTGVSLGVYGVLDSVSAHRIMPGTLGGATVMDIRGSRPTAWTRLVKALVDRVLGVVLLAVAAIPLLALMAVVRIDSRGPALFKQTRVGRHGRQFTVYKLRTMRDGSEVLKSSLLEDNDADQVLFKIRRDPRVTRVGWWLRRSSVDELPQLLNVVRGNMSLVGPRPALPDEVAEYDASARRRLAVKPGMTGLWQVSGRSDLPWDEAVSLDVRYVDNVRLTDDLLIAGRTVGAVVRARGAY